MRVLTQELVKAKAQGFVHPMLIVKHLTIAPVDVGKPRLSDKPGMKKEKHSR